MVRRWWVAERPSDWPVKRNGAIFRRGGVGRKKTKTGLGGGVRWRETLVAVVAVAFTRHD